MERLGKKLRSERGASILLALLMFLVCAMVGATVLAAAVSNAGKARSNRTEQQKFLNLTSAVQLVADEIANKATYTGKYTVWEWEEVETVKETDTSVTPHLETTVSSNTVRSVVSGRNAGAYGKGKTASHRTVTAADMDSSCMAFQNQRLRAPTLMHSNIN